MHWIVIHLVANTRYACGLVHMNTWVIAVDIVLRLSLCGKEMDWLVDV